MKGSTKSVIVFTATAAALAALVYFSYVYDAFRQTKKRKPSRKRSTTPLNLQQARRETSSRPCCVVAPISPSKLAESVKTCAAQSTANEITNPAESRVLSLAVHEANTSGKVLDSDNSSTISSFSSLSNDAQPSSSESGLSTSSKSTSDDSISERRRNSLSASVKPLTDDEFNNLLNSPVVQSMHEDIRMSRSRESRSSITQDIVQEYEPSIVDSFHDNVYRTYHDIVPPLQPYTRPVIFQPSE